MIYYHACSLGPFCHAGSILKQLDVKKESYPFDWIYSNLDVIIHCIEDDFKTFLDKSYYKREKDITIHTYYTEKFKKCSFNHVTEMTDEKYEYFIRCVERFRKLLQSPKKKLFIISHMVTATDTVDPDYYEKTIEFNKKLKQYTTNFDILCIAHNTQNKFSYAINTHDNIYFMKLETASISNGVIFTKGDENHYLVDILCQNFKFNIETL